MMMTFLVQIDREMQLFQESFSGRWQMPDFNLPWSWIFAVAGALMASLVVWNTLQRDRSACGPAMRQLCVALLIDSRQRRLLSRVSRIAGHQSPASLMLSRGCFENAAEAYTRRYGPSARLDVIRLAIFDG